MIAVEEARHADLAWDILAWTVQTGGGPVERGLGEVLAELDQRKAPRMPPIPELDLRSRGATPMNRCVSRGRRCGFPRAKPGRRPRYE